MYSKSMVTLNKLYVPANQKNLKRKPEKVTQHRLQHSASVPSHFYTEQAYSSGPLLECKLFRERLSIWLEL